MRKNNLKTNNFDELPDIEELWIKLDSDYTLKVYYEDDKWYECIVKKVG